MADPAARNPDDAPLPLERDLHEDEPDLPTDEELDDLAPPLPAMETDPMAPMAPVPPGPDTPISPLPEASGIPEGSLEEMAEAVEEGRLPE